ncbi:hypothetical protein TNIN_21201 [Trichonephila inaurata madagascariensis]|uniref:Uncharacterized protein n=1 Tax=Trichonephila inaurata madagascariensis TaxID=2747483 RepID=A0A8X6YAP2_9ARAC|nr:hypothetical protein TNIN_21201 [Trichonephila inaurata madagascariensis]
MSNYRNIEPARIRTWNLLIRSQVRYPLRHCPSDTFQGIGGVESFTIANGLQYFTVDKLTPETKSGKSKALSFTTPKPLSPSFRACIKDSSGGFVNPETKDASKSSQIPTFQLKIDRLEKKSKSYTGNLYLFSVPKKVYIGLGWPPQGK